MTSFIAPYAFLTVQPENCVRYSVCLTIELTSMLLPMIFNIQGHAAYLNTNGLTGSIAVWLEETADYYKTIKQKCKTLIQYTYMSVIVICVMMYCTTVDVIR
jgi:hypothetical protein